MKRFGYNISNIFIIIIFLFFCNKLAFAQEYNILSDKEFLEIAETVSFVYFQLHDLQSIDLPFINNIDTKKESSSDIKEAIMKEYRNILFKTSENYLYGIDTFYHPIFDKLGVRLFNSHYTFKKYSDNIKGRLKNYKMAIDQCGKCYKLFGFGYKSDDFEELYRTYFTKLNSTSEVFDIIKFYVYNVLFNQSEIKFVIIDSTNINMYSKFYPEISLNIINKSNNLWTVKFNILLYSTSYKYVELVDYTFLLNEQDRNFTYKESLIKKYKYIEKE